MAVVNSDNIISKIKQKYYKPGNGVIFLIVTMFVFAFSGGSIALEIALAYGISGVLLVIHGLGGPNYISSNSISDEVCELGKSILTDPDWYLEHTYFYNKKFNTTDNNVLGVNKGVVLMVNRGIELNNDPKLLKFTGTGIGFLNDDEKCFLHEIIKTRLLQDMVYKENIPDNNKLEEPIGMSIRLLGKI